MNSNNDTFIRQQIRPKKEITGSIDGLSFADLVEEEPQRLDKHNYYLNIADSVSMRGTCLRRNYGAVIVNNDEIISTGYNGAPRGRKNCSDLGYCIRQNLNIPRGERYEMCLSGDTLIKLLNGNYITIRDFANIEGALWVYTVDDRTGAIIPTLAHSARPTKIADMIVRVHFDDGGFIDCTEDHRILMRDLTYKEAGKLMVGDSVMPCNYIFQNANHEYVHNTPNMREESRWVLKSDDIRASTNIIETHKLVYEYFHGPIPKGYVVHHEDFNPHNNTPENLVLLTKEEHISIHNCYNIQHGLTSFGTTQSALKGIATQKYLFENDENYRNKKIEVGRKNMTNNWNNEEWRKMMEPHQVASGAKLAARFNKDPEVIRKRHRGMNARAISELLFRMKQAGDERIITMDNYDIIRSDYAGTGTRGGQIQIPKLATILKNYDTFEEALNAGINYNHKVMAIEYLPNTQIVYDLTVEGPPNFAVVTSPGHCILVHNCRSVHGEQNAIISAPRSKMIGGTLYLCGRDKETGEYIKDADCCSMCKRMIINAGISKVVIRDTYNDYRVIPVEYWIVDDDSLNGGMGY